MTKRLTAALSLVVLLLAACQRPEPNPWFGQWSLRAEDAKGDPETLIYSDAGTEPCGCSRSRREASS